MTNADKQTTLRIYEFMKTRGCATIEEIAQAVGVPARQAYSAMRTLFARRLVLPYRPQVGRERIYCIPTVGDKLYGRATRANSSGMICITLPVDLIEIIDEIATSTGKTRSSIIKQALIELLNNNPREDKQQKIPEDDELDLIIPDR